MFQLENFIGIMCHSLKGDAKFKGNLTRGLKDDIRNLVNFHATSCKSKIWTLMGLFCPKDTKF